MPNGGRIDPVVRARVWEREGGRCQCKKDCPEHVGRKCCKALALTQRISRETGVPVANIHHKKKRGHGGGQRDDRPENLECQCEPCHAREPE